MKFYLNERETGGFEAGIRTALQAMLASPHFVFRLEEAPASARAGQTYKYQRSRPRVAAVVLPLGQRCRTTTLIAAAARGTLGTPAGLEQQTRRMLADPRASALSTRFAAQWLRLQDLDKIHPDARLYPQFDSHARRRDASGDRALLRQHRPRGP